ncbi:MAG: hypothetical protein ACLQCU_09320 [Acidimicrobiales bacterium]
MSKQVAVAIVARADEAAELEGLPGEVTLALAEVAGAMREGLLAFASATGLRAAVVSLTSRMRRGRW